MSLLGNIVVPLWVKLALLAALVAAGAASGNAARGHWDAGDIATANAATLAANADRDKWKASADGYSDAIDEQNKATAQAQADAKRDAALATHALEAAAVAEQDYLRRRRQIDAQAKQDASAPCASVKIQGSPLQ